MRRILLAALLSTLAIGCSAPMNRDPAPQAARNPVAPIVIAHRGASGYRPEHTLAAYEHAIELGADFIEPDLVPTRDGVLIARHENELGGSTDVGSRPEFAGRRTTKRIDGVEVTGWFSEDFTLAEIKRLRAREPLPQLRAASAAFDGQFTVATFAEVIALAAAHGVGIYPETKHPTFFRHEGQHLDGSPIAIDISQALVDTLLHEGFTDPQRIYIQSFELANLLDLKTRILPAAGLSLPLVQLIGNADAELAQSGDGFSQPYDIVWHARRGDDLRAIYGRLDTLVAGLDDTTTWSQLVEPATLRWMADNYASGIGPWKVNLLPRKRLDPPRNVGGRAIGAQLLGSTAPMLAAARAAGLQVHPYTVRAEAPYLALDPGGALIDAEAEVRLLLAAGATGVFIDHPDIGVRVRESLQP